MIATITAQPRRIHHMQEFRNPRSANTAGAPLPLVPRRSSSNRVPGGSAPGQSTGVVKTYSLVSSNSTPSFPVKKSAKGSSESDGSSSEDSRSTISMRTKRTPSRVPALLPSAKATRTVPPSMALMSQPITSPPITPPFPQKESRPLMYAPGMSLKSCVEATRTRAVTELTLPSSARSPARATSVPAITVHDEKPPLIRKKSGQPVKSSLKSSKSASARSLKVMTISTSSKSEPSTPTLNKVVHFDAQLEHVKLFLAEQKPLAVSRDGSPTEDTSGTDSDFPSFIFGDDKPSKKLLVMQVHNMPPKVNLAADVALDELVLSADRTSVLGHVRVRNIAFTKWVAVRFTFDFWQTTSEVTGRFVESINPEFDRFAFTIRLNDLLARIEGKTLQLAIRYNVTGQEIWDNNTNKNYCVSFTKAKPVEPKKVSDEEVSTDIDNLRSRLEKVVQGSERTGPAFIAQKTCRSRTLGESAPSIIKSSVSLASRYDFGASLKNPWNPSSPLFIHSRNQSFPQVAPSPPSSVRWPEQASLPGLSSLRTAAKSPPNLGSPRDLNDDFIHVRSLSDIEGLPPRDRSVRNHQRGYFDLALSSTGLRRTPPGTPSIRSFDDLTPVFASRLRLFSPVDYRVASTSTTENGTISMESSGESELSTPSIATPCSSPGSLPFPVKADADVFLDRPSLPSDDEDSTDTEIHYHNFINKFCFFTGGQVEETTETEDIARSQSASDVEELLSAVAPLVKSRPPMTPPRSSSVDDILTTSGTATPTTPKPNV